MMVKVSDAPSNLQMYADADSADGPAYIGFKMTVDGLQYGDLVRGEEAKRLARAVLGLTTPQDIRDSIKR